jgi:hypothetical protein
MSANTSKFSLTIVEGGLEGPVTTRWGSSVSTPLDSLERAQSNETAAPPAPYDQHGPEHKIPSPPSHSSDHDEGGAGYPARASVEEWKALDEECGHARAMDQCRYATAFETW